MFDPSVGRWLSVDPIGFEAGDVNLFRYVENNPTNNTDPSGLWTWKLGPKGEIFAMSEKDDTLNDLIAVGYPKEQIRKIATQSKLKMLDEKLPAGKGLNLSLLFPDRVQQVLKRQQNLEWDDKNLSTFLSRAGAPAIPKGKTLGTSGIDLMQDVKFDEDKGKFITKRIHGHSFGMGNCYGLIALCREVKSPKNLPPSNLTLGWIKGEQFGFSDFSKPGFHPATKPYPKEVGLVGSLIPKGGLRSYLIGKRKETKKPRFGALALFGNDKEINHAAFVLGKSQAGTVYVLQKKNVAEPYTITPVSHPYLKRYQKVTYYE